MAAQAGGARGCGALGEVGGRREFLRVALAAAAGAACGLFPLPLRAFPGLRPDPKETVKRFEFAQLRYRGGDWDPAPSGPAELLSELERMTSVEARPARVVLDADAPELFSHPFLWMAGHADFEPFSTGQLARLRSWLEAGGTLVADDAACTPGYGFDAAFRRELARIWPGARLERLPADHTVFKSFFLIRSVAGRQAASPFLEGLTVQGRTPVVFCGNDLLGAFARDPLGRWANPCAPGGERQRRAAFHLGVNIVMYALCADYKQDRIHVPFLRQRI
jgi:hypothetical protein